MTFSDSRLYFELCYAAALVVSRLDAGHELLVRRGLRELDAEGLLRAEAHHFDLHRLARQDARNQSPGANGRSDEQDQT